MTDYTDTDLKRLDKWIAEWMGYFVVQISTEHITRSIYHIYNKDTKEYRQMFLRFTQSLDSLRPVWEKIEEDELSFIYGAELLLTLGFDPLDFYINKQHNGLFKIITATALQHCLALYKTVTGKDFEGRKG